MNDPPYFPPFDSEYPILVTNQLYPKGHKIKEVLMKILGNPNMDTIVAVSPFVSEYFVKLLAQTQLKYLILVINRDDFNPDYVTGAVNLLKDARFDVDVRSRPPNSKFNHMKMMIPFMRITRVEKSGGKTVTKSTIVPSCAIAGSMNFTKNGIDVSDEMLVIFKDPYSINGCMETYRQLIDKTVIKYSSKYGSKA
jgi:phosphatidylserine/phosphatidylglycerophosphate/cardiolipin synthase-like enzyme